MSFFRRIHLALRKIFRRYNSHILILSGLIAILTGYMQFKLKHDDLEWKELKQLLEVFNEKEALILFPLMLFVTILMVVFIIAINFDSIRCYDELTQLQMRKRYADYLFIQLVTRLDNIEKKHLDGNTIPMDKIIQAHEEMQSTINKFRKDTKKLLALSDGETLVPPEMVFADEEIQSSRFAHLSPEEDMILELAAS